MAGRFDDGHLHAEADAEIGHLVFAGELRGVDLAFRPALAKTAGHQDAVDLFEIGRRVFLFEDLRLDPLELDLDAIGDAAVIERLDQRLVGVLEARVLADDGNGHFAFRRADAVADLFPLVETGFWRRLDAEGGQHFRIEAFLVIGHRHVVDIGDVERLDDGRRPHIAEQRQLAAFSFRDLAVGAHKQDIGVNAERLQFLDRMLGRLGLQLAGGRDIGHERQMDVGRRCHAAGRCRAGGSPP